MDVQRMIEALNRSLSVEYAAVIQYMQSSFLVQGTEREYLAEFFRNEAKGSLGHVQRFGEKIVALGGLPTVEPVAVKQAADVGEMLQQALALEKEAQACHFAALRLLPPEEQEEAADTALRVMLEDLVEQEQQDIEELEKLLAMRRPAVAVKEVRFRQVR